MRMLSITSILLVTWIIFAVPRGALADCRVSPGTVITKSNWHQYVDCFSDGVQVLWQGSEFWRMPDDVEIHVGQQHSWTLPKSFTDATEQYGSQTRLVKQPNGRYKLDNYVAGFPFSHPGGPNRGTEIAANITYRMQGYLQVFADDLGNASTIYTKDRFGNWSGTVADADYRQLAYNWESDEGVSKADVGANGAWYSEWVMIEKPEQSKYTTVLTLFWQDNLRDEDDYVFVPTLRRSLRLSSSARCAPFLGSDMVKDDQRQGWNGGVGKFDADFIREQKLLTLVTLNGKAAGNFPDEYDGMLGWPKPSWGEWETRDVDVIDIHRVPSLAQGYCYGRRVVYADKQYYSPLAEDIYDANMKLWKIVWMSLEPNQLDHYGEQMNAGGFAYIYWDIQNDHASYVSNFNSSGAPILWDSKVPLKYNDIPRFTTPGGLMQIMR
jgi:uncharacterized protein DUF1329